MNKSARLIMLIALGIFVLYVKLSTVATHSGKSAGTGWSDTTSASEGAIPGKALHVLQVVRQTGGAPEGYEGGRVFENREGRLPDGGDYREFDVDPHHGQRNAERIIVDWTTKKAWYTGDHYRTFIPMP